MKAVLSGDRKQATPDLSIVIPVFNERDNLDPLFEEVRVTLDLLGRPYEIVFVDDGSQDGSLEVLRRLRDSNSCVRLIELARNFGQTAAMSAGFDHSRGRIIIPMDADLQNDPADIPRILETLAQGYDVVSCWRKDRHDSLTRVVPSRMANRLVSWWSGVRLHDYGCTLKGYRRNIVKNIRLYGEMHRFIPVYAYWAGARVTEITVGHRPRHSGRSKYGFIRAFKVPLDLLTIKFLSDYSTKPMYLFGGLGAASMVLGTVCTAGAAYQKVFEAVKVHRNPLLILAIFFFLTGIQFVLFGLIGELIIRTYHESQGKPTYLVREEESAGQPDSSSGLERAESG